MTREISLGEAQNENPTSLIFPQAPPLGSFRRKASRIRSANIERPSWQDLAVLGTEKAPGAGIRVRGKEAKPFAVMFYVTHRWLGGATLTNWATLQKQVHFRPA